MQKVRLMVHVANILFVASRRVDGTKLTFAGHDHGDSVRCIGGDIKHTVWKIHFVMIGITNDDGAISLTGIETRGANTNTVLLTHVQGTGLKPNSNIVTS